MYRVWPCHFSQMSPDVYTHVDRLIYIISLNLYKGPARQGLVFLLLNMCHDLLP